MANQDMQNITCSAQGDLAEHAQFAGLCAALDQAFGQTVPGRASIRFTEISPHRVRIELGDATEPARGPFPLEWGLLDVAMGPQLYELFATDMARAAMRQGLIQGAD